MSEKDVKESRGSFSWKAETNEALGSYIEKGKDKSSYASSIFSSPNNTDYSSLSDGYKYDFPKDNGYIYSPSAHTSSSQSKSAIFSDRTEKNSAPQKRQTAERKDVKQQQGKGTKKKNPPSKKEAQKKDGRFDFISGLGSGAKKRGEESGKDNRRENPGRPPRKRPPQNRASSDERRRKEESALQRRQAQSRQNRELERERRESVRRDRNNIRFDDSRTKGISADESRRAQMKKKQTNRKFYAVICALVLIIGAVAALAGYGIVEGAPIAKIVVEGNETYKKKDILAAAGITTGDNMLLIREKKTNSVISTSLPYIESVEVKYEFPDTLKLNITETKDKVHIMMGKNMLTLNANGKVLSNKKKKISGGNYKIIGIEKQDYNIGYVFEADKDNGNDKKYALAKEIIETLEKTGITGFRDISFEDMKCITVSTTEGISLYINEKTPLERQFNLAKEAIAEKQKTKAKGYFDLRFDEMVVHN